MKILNYARGAGKTYEAVEYARKNGCVLAVSHKIEKDYIKKTYEYPHVYTIGEILNGEHLGLYKKYCMVFDNIELILRSLTYGYYPEMITITGAEVNTKVLEIANELEENIVEIPEFVDKYIGEIEEEEELRKKQVEEFVMERLRLRCPEFAEYIKTIGYEVGKTELVFKLGHIKLYIFPQIKKNKIEFAVFTDNSRLSVVNDNWFSTSNCKKAVAEFFRRVRKSK